MIVGKTGIELKGFDEFYESLQRKSKNADTVAGKQFNKCMEIIETELKTKSQAAGLAPRLINQIQKQTERGRSSWRGEVGWHAKKGNGGQASDFEKIVFFNYGTPTRHTKVDYVKKQIDGKWVTVGQNRGSIKKHNFVKKAKLAASRKTQTLMKKTLKEILNR